MSSKLLAEERMGNCAGSAARGSGNRVLGHTRSSTITRNDCRVTGPHWLLGTTLARMLLSAGLTMTTSPTQAAGSRCPVQLAERSTSMHSDLTSETGLRVQAHDGPRSRVCATDSREVDDDRVFTPTGLRSRCCDQPLVAVTSAGCEFCREHCEQFTWWTLAEMGTGPCKGVINCLACDGPECVSAQVWEPTLDESDTGLVDALSTAHARSPVYIV